MANPTEIETQSFFGNGRIEIHYGGRLYVISNSELTREHVDAWYEKMSELHKHWQDNQPLLVMIDTTACPTTPYFRQRIMELHTMAQVLPIKTYKAILAAPENSKELQVFAALTSFGSKHRLKIFSDREEAMQWLESGL
jgi:hypothetical protein